MSDLPTIESLDEAVKAIWPSRKWSEASLCVGFPTMKPAFIAHAHTLDLLHGRKPVDPIEVAIKAASKEAYRLCTSGYHEGFERICRKHFAGLTFPKGDAA